MTYNVLSYIGAEMIRTLQRPFFKSSLCGRYWYGIMKLGGRSQAIRQVTDGTWCSAVLPLTEGTQQPGGMSYIFNLLPRFAEMSSIIRDHTTIAKERQ